jgi:hypothetical protein
MGAAMRRTEPYRPSPVNRPTRKRGTRAQVEQRRAALLAITEANKPMTVRQLYYQATVRGLVDKTQRGYRRVQEDTVFLRNAGRMPRRWLTDSTRWQRRLPSYGGIEDALEQTARLYRRSLWASAGCHVEVWLEKDALAGVVFPVTAGFDVPLMVARGYSSLSFLSVVAEDIAEAGVPVFIYHVGDFDPSGLDAGRAIEAKLREYAPDAEISFRRLAVTPEQIRDWDLPTRPTKTTDSRAKGFGAVSVELDAIPPDRLRSLVHGAIEQHLPAGQLEVIKAAEDSEREILLGMVARLRDAR